jgi:hypothetical protein
VENVNESNNHVNYQCLLFLDMSRRALIHDTNLSRMRTHSNKPSGVIILNSDTDESEDDLQKAISLSLGTPTTAGFGVAHLISWSNVVAINFNLDSNKTQ